MARILWIYVNRALRDGHRRWNFARHLRSDRRPDHPPGQPDSSAYVYSDTLSVAFTGAVDPTSEDLTEVVAEYTNGLGADVVLVCSGIPSMVNDAFRLAHKGGRVNVFRAGRRGLTQFS